MSFFAPQFTVLSSDGEETMIKGGRPCCPNHGEPLEDVPVPIPNKGSGICPVSRCRFDFEADIENAVEKKDKFGNVTYEYDINIIGSES